MTLASTGHFFGDLLGLSHNPTEDDISCSIHLRIFWMSPHLSLDSRMMGRQSWCLEEDAQIFIKILAFVRDSVKLYTYIIVFC